MHKSLERNMFSIILVLFLSSTVVISPEANTPDSYLKLFVNVLKPPRRFFEASVVLVLGWIRTFFFKNNSNFKCRVIYAEFTSHTVCKNPYMGKSVLSFSTFQKVCVTNTSFVYQHSIEGPFVSPSSLAT